MKSKHTRTIPILAVLLVFALLGGPQIVAAQAAQQTNEQSGTTQPPASAQLPEAPSAQQPVGTPALPQDQQQSDSQQQNNGAQQPKAQEQKTQDQTPVGAAAAQKGETAGGAASKPAGTAIAPAKQRQVRSLLLKMGLIAAGGAAIGIVYALSRGTPSVPPGSGR